MEYGNAGTRPMNGESHSLAADECGTKEWAALRVRCGDGGWHLQFERLPKCSVNAAISTVDCGCNGWA